MLSTSRTWTWTQPLGQATAYVCGSHGFAEHASRLLLSTGWNPAGIRIERFGPR